MTKRRSLVAAVLVIGVMALLFAAALRPARAAAGAAPVIFSISRGESFTGVIAGLSRAGLIRSSLAAGAFSLFTGSAFSLQPGEYRLSPSQSAPALLRELSGGGGREVSVTIPPDANVYQDDALLSAALVIPRGALISFAAAHGGGGIEGKLFPDTYRFFTGSPVAEVVQKMLADFQAKAGPALAQDPANATSDLIVASIAEKEVPDPADQAIVAGILWKRKNAGMPLQVDATVCYAMQVADPAGTPDCGALDLKINSPYNTYLYKGFPPGPIGSPDISAIEAAARPKRSPYWYYLSDPKTGKTIYAITLDEQHRNTVKYLESH